MRKEDLEQIDGNSDALQSRQQVSNNFLTPLQFQSPIRLHESSAALIPQSDFIQKMIPKSHSMITSNKQMSLTTLPLKFSDLQRKANLTAHCDVTATPRPAGDDLKLNPPSSGTQAQDVAIDSELWNSWIRVEDCLQQGVKDSEIEVALRRMNSELDAVLIRADHLKALLRLKLEPHIDKPSSVLINIFDISNRSSGSNESILQSEAGTSATSATAAVCRSAKSEKDDIITLNRFRALMKRKYGVEISASAIHGPVNCGKWGSGDSLSISPFKKKKIT